MKPVQVSHMLLLLSSPSSLSCCEVRGRPSVFAEAPSGRNLMKEAIAFASPNVSTAGLFIQSNVQYVLYNIHFRSSFLSFGKTTSTALSHRRRPLPASVLNSAAFQLDYLRGSTFIKAEYISCIDSMVSAHVRATRSVQSKDMQLYLFRRLCRGLVLPRGQYLTLADSLEEPELTRSPQRSFKAPQRSRPQQYAVLICNAPRASVRSAHI